MNYEEITRVETLYNSNEVNKYLDLGWKLLLVYDDPPNFTARFVLGWAAKKDVEPKYPKQDDGVDWSKFDDQFPDYKDANPQS